MAAVTARNKILYLICFHFLNTVLLPTTKYLTCYVVLYISRPVTNIELLYANELRKGHQLTNIMYLNIKCVRSIRTRPSYQWHGDDYKSIFTHNIKLEFVLLIMLGAETTCTKKNVFIFESKIDILLRPIRARLTWLQLLSSDSN